MKSEICNETGVANYKEIEAARNEAIHTQTSSLEPKPIKCSCKGEKK